MFPRNVDYSLFKCSNCECSTELVRLFHKTEDCQSAISPSVVGIQQEQEELTQYTKAQYQHSIKKGNLRNSLLSARLRNAFVSGVITLFFQAQNPISRFLQRRS
jgi:hypothetical protein